MPQGQVSASCENVLPVQDQRVALDTGGGTMCLANPLAVVSQPADHRNALEVKALLNQSAESMPGSGVR